MLICMYVCKYMCTYMNIYCIHCIYVRVYVNICTKYINIYIYSMCVYLGILIEQSDFRNVHMLIFECKDIRKLLNQPKVLPRSL